MCKLGITLYLPKIAMVFKSAINNFCQCVSSLFYFRYFLIKIALVNYPFMHICNKQLLIFIYLGFVCNIISVK